MANIQFQLRRGLASLWTSVNPILSSGEMGVETDTNKIKIGNGNSGWTSLAYVAGADGISGPYVISVNGATGIIQNVAKTNTTNSFDLTQTFSSGFQSSKEIFVQNMIFGRGGYGNSTNLTIGVNTNTGQTGSAFANLIIGNNSLSVNEIGEDTVAIGNRVLDNIVTSLYNTAIGNNTLRFITDTSNTNLAVGYNAGSYRGITGTSPLTIANNSIFIGPSARPLANASTNELVIGYNALGLGNNSTVIGNTSITNARIYGLLNLPSGLSASGATFSNIVNLDSNTIYKPTLQYYNEPISSPSISGNTLSLDLSLAQVFNVSLNAGISSFIVTNIPQTASRAIGFSLFLTADGTTRGISWGSTVKWPSATPPILTTTNNKTDILSFTTLNGGTSWFGRVAGQNY